MATENDYTVFNGVCGGQSGIVNVSTVAPTIFLQEIELQKIAGVPQKPPILTSPFWIDMDIQYEEK